MTNIDYREMPWSRGKQLGGMLTRRSSRSLAIQVSPTAYYHLCLLFLTSIPQAISGVSFTDTLEG